MSLIIIFITVLFFLITFWYYKKVWFFRDPKRTFPKGQNQILAPCDGNVIYIKEFKNGEVVSEKLGQEIKITEITKMLEQNNDGWIIGIYMKPTDVHFNYAPIDGAIEKMVYTKAKLNLPMLDVWEYIKFVWLHRFINLWSKKYHWENERNTIFLSKNDIKIAMVEIADKFVNKIDLFVKEGEIVKAGQKMSFIKRGSQVDLVIYKKELDLKVKLGQQVYGAETVLSLY